MVIQADLGGKSLSEPHSASGGIPADWVIYRHYHITEGGSRGAAERTARAFGVTAQHVRNVIKRHAERRPPLQLCHVNAAPLPTAELPRPVVAVPGLTESDITRDAKLAADAWLAGFVVLTWLAVWLCWVPILNGVLGGAALIAGHLAADAGRVYRDVR